MLNNPSASATPVQQTTGAFFEAICGSFCNFNQLVDPISYTIFPSVLQLDWGCSYACNVLKLPGNGIIVESAEKVEITHEIVLFWLL